MGPVSGASEQKKAWGFEGWANVWLLELGSGFQRFEAMILRLLGSQVETLNLHPRWNPIYWEMVAGECSLKLA